VIAPVIHALLELLDDMRSMIERIDDDSYAAPAPGRTGGGIGGHVRHCLDHVGAFVAGTRTGLCAYDRRARGTLVERCRASAIQRIDDLVRDLAHAGTDLDVTVAVETQLDTRGTTAVTMSTLGRELVFVTSHTTHHNALIAHLLASHGVDMDERFGLAPATPSHPACVPCAP
jgi:hypothetical protein